MESSNLLFLCTNSESVALLAALLFEASACKTY
jgi:hypothetical protein